MTHKPLSMSRHGLLVVATTVMVLAFAGRPGLAAGAGTNAGRPDAALAAAAATATPLPLGGVDLSGRWSITRTWWRRCPRCGGSVIRTTPWKVTQTGDQLRVDRGPKGNPFYDGAGTLRLNLSGLESEGSSVYRFWYSSLVVSPDGNTFEGGFAGSENTLSPCGGDIAQASCFASAGWLRARRIATPVPLPTPRRPLLMLAP